MTNHIIPLLPILLLTACATDSGSRKNEKQDASEFVRTSYHQAVDRFTQNYFEDGWVVSRKQDGSTEHEGDSLIWTGLAMASLSCDSGRFISKRMAKMVADNSGALVRYEPLGEYAGGREISFDGATGLYYGLFNRLRRCPEDTDIWRDVWAEHLAFLVENNYRLHPNVDATVMPQFNSIRDYISFQLGILEDEPASWRYRTLEGMAMTWASAVTESKQPCFRVHLAWLYMSFLDDAGVLLDSAYTGFCYATEPAKLPIVDHWCNRISIEKWAKGFEFNKWEYENQRCPDWETPDAGSLKTPALDLIFNLAFAYPELLND